MTQTAYSMMILGEAASPGIARGRAFVCACAEHEAARKYGIREDEIPAELEKFSAAAAKAEKDLRVLQDKILRTAGPKEAAIFEAHIALLHDPLLRDEVKALLREKKINVEAALEEAAVKITSLFLNLEDPYFRERAADMRDVARRLSNTLTRDGAPEPKVFPPGSVIITSELLPSILAQLDRKAVRALVIEKGGQTAHATILARAAGVPLLIAPGAAGKIRAGQLVLVDGLAGRIFVNPGPEIIREYDKLEADLETHRRALKGLIDLPSVTRDGTAVKLYANIGKTADAELAAKSKADGIGLYRTEFVYMAADHLPSEEEQYQIYCSTVKRLDSREAVIRLLDIGSDKILPYLPLPAEANPSLGRRGIRFLLAHPEILHAQLRAILRVSARHPVSILFPMVNGIDDVQAAKAAVERAKASLAEDRLLFDKSVRFGAMIETPSAAVMARKLAQEVDYFSIGTNDLVQYLLTTDRTSSAMASYYEPLHPAVIQILASVVSAAVEKGKSVSICGEAAGNPAYTELLLGLGFRSFSVSPGELLEIKNVIRSADLKRAENLASRVLNAATIAEVKDCLRDHGALPALQK